MIFWLVVTIPYSPYYPVKAHNVQNMNFSLISMDELRSHPMDTIAEESGTAAAERQFHTIHWCARARAPTLVSSIKFRMISHHYFYFIFYSMNWLLSRIRGTAVFHVDHFDFQSKKSVFLFLLFWFWSFLFVTPGMRAYLNWSELILYG